MPSHHSSHHSSSHHSSSHHSSSTHHSTPIHHDSMRSGPIHHDPMTGAPIMYRRSRGRGCLIGSVIVGIVVIVFAFGIFEVVQQSFRAASAAVSGASAAGANLSSGGDLTTDPTVIADLAVMHTALDALIPTWQAQKDTIVHHVSFGDAGLPSNFNTKEVVYGTCAAGQFYTFVLNVTRPEDTTADTEGYEYLPSSDPMHCAPAGWNIMTSEVAASNWYFVTVDTSAATTEPPSASAQ